MDTCGWWRVAVLADGHQGQQRGGLGAGGVAEEAEGGTKWQCVAVLPSLAKTS
jgi:hypothetical protein